MKAKSLYLFPVIFISCFLLTSCTKKVEKATLKQQDWLVYSNSTTNLPIFSKLTFKENIFEISTYSKKLTEADEEKFITNLESNLTDFSTQNITGNYTLSKNKLHLTSSNSSLKFLNTDLQLKQDKDLLYLKNKQTYKLIPYSKKIFEKETFISEKYLMKLFDKKLDYWLEKLDFPAVLAIKNSYLAFPQIPSEKQEELRNLETSLAYLEKLNNLLKDNKFEELQEQFLMYPDKIKTNNSYLEKIKDKLTLQETKYKETLLQEENKRKEQERLDKEKAEQDALKKQETLQANEKNSSYKIKSTEEGISAVQTLVAGTELQERQIDFIKFEDPLYYYQITSYSSADGSVKFTFEISVNAMTGKAHFTGNNTTEANPDYQGEAAYFPPINHDNAAYHVLSYMKDEHANCRLKAQITAVSEHSFTVEVYDVSEGLLNTYKITDQGAITLLSSENLFP